VNVPLTIKWKIVRSVPLHELIKVRKTVAVKKNLYVNLAIHIATLPFKNSCSS